MGYIENRLKYEESLLRKFRGCEKSPDTNVEKNNNRPSIVGEMGELIESMKTIVITDESMPVLKQNLKKSRDFRDKLLANNEVDLLEMFPYFFVKPELVGGPW